jgi:uncharacterized protein YuzE
MKIEYFTDTDTLLIEFKGTAVADTRDLNENTLVEFDSEGRLVSITIEHAKEQADVEEFVFHPGKSQSDRIYKVAEETPDYKAKRAEL